MEAYKSMGNRKMKIDMQTTVQTVSLKDGIGFDDFFRLHDRFIQDKKLEGLRDSTIKEHEAHIKWLKDFALQSGKDYAVVDEIFLKDYISHMSFEKQYSPFTVNIRLRTLRCYCRWLHTEGHTPNNLSLKLKLLKTPQDSRQPLKDNTVKQLLNACDLTTYAGYRDFCVIITILDCGIRIGELAQLQVNDIDVKQYLIRIRSDVSKTVTERILPISKKTAKYLAQLVDIAEKMDSDFVFQSTYSGRIEKQNLMLSFRRLANKAGVKATPYQLRHSFATNAVKAGMDLFSLQRIMGHSVMQTTRSYVQLDTEDLKKIHSKYSIVDKFIK